MWCCGRIDAKVTSEYSVAKYGVGREWDMWKIELLSRNSDFHQVRTEKFWRLRSKKFYHFLKAWNRAWNLFTLKDYYPSWEEFHIEPLKRQLIKDEKSRDCSVLSWFTCIRWKVKIGWWSDICSSDLHHALQLLANGFQKSELLLTWKNVGKMSDQGIWFAGTERFWPRRFWGWKFSIAYLGRILLVKSLRWPLPMGLWLFLNSLQKRGWSLSELPLIFCYSFPTTNQRSGCLIHCAGLKGMYHLEGLHFMLVLWLKAWRPTSMRHGRWGYSDEAFWKRRLRFERFSSQAFSCQASSKPPYRSDIDFVWHLIYMNSVVNSPQIMSLI